MKEHLVSLCRLWAVWSPGIDSLRVLVLKHPVEIRQGAHVEKAIFGEYMQVANINDGPVTFLLGSSKLF